MKTKIFRFMATWLALQFLPGTGFSAEQAKVQEGKRSGPVVVALVPISESPSQELRDLAEELESRLGRTKGVRVLDRSRTNEMLDYYRSHVASMAKTTSQNPALTTARELIRDARYSEAEKYLDQVEVSTDVRPMGDDLAQVYILRAKIFHGRNRENEVREQFEKLVRINPDFEFDARLYGKWALNGLKRAKEKILSAGTGSLTVTSLPEACDVFINGFRRGLTPLSLGNMPVGNHVVEVRTVNHKPSVQEIQIKPAENIVLKETLERQRTASKASQFVALSPRQYGTDEELSRLISSLGYHLGADKVILLTEGEDSKLSYRLGDTHLGAIQTLHEINFRGESRNEQIAAVTQAINSEARTDILKNPRRYADQTVGSVALHEKRKSPFYKKPLFWVLVGAGAGTGGVLSAVLGGAAAVIGPGGILIGL